MGKAIGYITVLAALLSACAGDDIAGNSGDTLEPDEAAAVLAAVSEILAGSLFEVSPSAELGPTAAAVPVNESVSLTANCPLGGSVSLSGRIAGDVDENRGSADVRFSFAESIRSCVLQHESNRITVHGSPSLQFEGSLSIETHRTSFALDGSMTVRGGFSYGSSDGRSGKCEVDVRSTWTTTRITQSGRVCGQNVNQSVAL